MKEDPIVKALEDSGVPLTTEGKHATRGWIQTECPFCTGKPGFHLGYNLSRRYFHCWRCGWKPTVAVLRELGWEAEEAWRIFRQAKSARPYHQIEREEKDRTLQEIKLPAGSGPLSKAARRYLIRRRFLPNRLEKIWQLRSTGPEGGKYKYRIIIPVFMDGRLLSFQARDYTGKASIPYLAPPNSQIKRLIYGWDYVMDGSAVVVEGVTDAWRIGPGAVATFGTGWTPEQRNILGTLRKALIAFDPEPQAQDRALRLAAELSMVGTEVQILEGLETDPGDMTEEEAKELRMIFYRWKISGS